MWGIIKVGSELFSEKFLVSQERVSGFPEKGADLRGSPGTSGKFGELPGKFGKLPGNLWIAVKFHSERTSGGSRGKLSGRSGNFQGSLGNFPEARGSMTPYQRLAKFVSNFLVSLKMSSEIETFKPGLKSSSAWIENFTRSIGIDF